MRRIGGTGIDHRKRIRADQERVRPAEGEGAGIAGGHPPDLRADLDRLVDRRLELSVELKRHARPGFLLLLGALSIRGKGRVEGRMK